MAQLRTHQIETSKKENEGRDEETPLANRKTGGETKDNSDSDSVESLQEVSIMNNNKNTNNTILSLNDSWNINKQLGLNGKAKYDAEVPQINLHRNCESEKEKEVKDNFKRKKSKKKKKTGKKDLPPIVNKPKRPLPQLPVLSEETEPSNDTSYC